MLHILKSADESMDFIQVINNDPDFSDPMLSGREQIQCNLLDAPNRPSHQLWGIFEKEELTGLFSFLILEEESYVEMLAGLSRSRKAYEEMFSYLKENYRGFQADFVYNPHNYLLHELLCKEKTEFETEQQKMELKKDVFYQSAHQITLYSPEYREQYCSMHSKDGYWTAEKVIDAQDRFRIILAIADHEVAGYIDVTHKYEENEPYDVFVKEEYRRKGYGKAMLAKAIELNKPKDMMLLVDVDKTAAIAMYESLGFVRAEGKNSLTAHVWL